MWATQLSMWLQNRVAWRYSNFCVRLLLLIFWKFKTTSGSPLWRQHRKNITWSRISWWESSPTKTLRRQQRSSGQRCRVYRTSAGCWWTTRIGWRRSHGMQDSICRWTCSWSRLQTQIWGYSWACRRRLTCRHRRAEWHALGWSSQLKWVMDSMQCEERGMDRLMCCRDIELTFN